MHKNLNIIYIFILINLLASSLAPSLAFAQKKMDLDDLTIKGELHGDDRLNILARERHTLKNYVKFRANYRAEMVEELPEPAQGALDRTHTK